MNRNTDPADTMTEADTTRHTPGPVAVQRIPGHYSYQDYLQANAGKNPVADFGGGNPYSAVRMGGNARRFAALWNEADRLNLSTEAVENGALAGLLDACRLLVQPRTGKPAECPADIGKADCECGLHIAVQMAQVALAKLAR